MEQRYIVSVQKPPHSELVCPQYKHLRTEQLQQLVLTCCVGLAGHAPEIRSARAHMPTGGVNDARPSVHARVRVACICRHSVQGNVRSGVQQWSRIRFSAFYLENCEIPVTLTKLSWISSRRCAVCWHGTSFVGGCRARELRHTGRALDPRPIPNASNAGEEAHREGCLKLGTPSYS